MADELKTVADLCRGHGLDAKSLAAQSGVEEGVVAAIILGRWTPSPEQRDAIAGAFGLTRDRVMWGHKTPIQHIDGQGPA